MNLESSVLDEFDREMARTRKTLERLPADKMEWKAQDGMHDLCWNANHLVDLIGWTPMVLQYDDFDMAPVDAEPMQVPTEKEPAKLLATFDKNVADARSALANVQSSTLMEPWSLKQAGQILFTIPKGECVRTWVLNHTIHHRAILSLLMRLAGIPTTPPYDE